LWFDGEFYEKLCGHLVLIYIRQFLTTILHGLLVDVPSAEIFKYLLKLKLFQTKAAGENEAYILCPIYFFLNSYTL
jgi:hypothetical protein